MTFLKGNVGLKRSTGQNRIAPGKFYKNSKNPECSRTTCGCGKVAPLHWDHDHELAALGFPRAETHRGWLCLLCNTGIGKLGDNVQGLMRALRYIQRALGAQI